MPHSRQHLIRSGEPGRKPRWARPAQLDPLTARRPSRLDAELCRAFLLWATADYRTELAISRSRDTLEDALPTHASRVANVWIASLRYEARLALSRGAAKSRKARNLIGKKRPAP